MLLLLLALQDWKAQFDSEWMTGDPARQRAAVTALAVVERDEVFDVLARASAQLEKRLAELEREKTRLQAEMKKIPADSLLNARNEIVDRPGYERRLKLDAEAKKVEVAIVDVEAVYASFADVFARGFADGAVRLAKKSEHWRVRYHAARGFAFSKSDATATALEGAVDDKDTRVSVAGVEGLLARGAGFGKIVAALGRPEWPVQLAAARALMKLDRVEAVEPLIAALEKADGRLQCELNDALVSLTGVDKHGVAQLWREWWESARADFEKARKPLAERQKELWAPRAGGSTFYGIPVRSKRIVFVVDRSESMAEKARWKDTSAASGPVDLRLVGDRKIDVCRYELKKALLVLAKDAEFNVVFFNRDVAAFAPSAMKATPENVKKAFAFIDSFEPRGRTNLFDPLEKAIVAAQADTVFLLTDGLPNCGQFEKPEEIRREIARLNTARLAVHAIYVGSEKGGEELLRGLAQENGGAFVNRSK